MAGEVEPGGSFPVGQPLGDDSRDAAFGVGQARPARDRTVPQWLPACPATAGAGGSSHSRAPATTPLSFTHRARIATGRPPLRRHPDTTGSAPAGAPDIHSHSTPWSDGPTMPTAAVLVRMMRVNALTGQWIDNRAHNMRLVPCSPFAMSGHCGLAPHRPQCTHGAHRGVGPGTAVKAHCDDGRRAESRWNPRGQPATAHSPGGTRPGCR
jgi:hypothetical protein